MFTKNEKNINKRLRVSIIVVMASLVINLFINISLLQYINNDISCESYFSVKSDVVILGVMNLHIIGGNSGRISLSATVNDGKSKVKYNVLRNIYFHYKNEGNGYISFLNMNVIKKAGDNTPDLLLNESVYDFSLKKRVIKITKLNDGYILWNEFSPVMICMPLTQ